VAAGAADALVYVNTLMVQDVAEDSWAADRD
jgi:hypothetical protein